MPYTNSAAQAGYGSVLNINTGTVTTPIWTLVGEVVDIAQSGKANKTDDVTNLQSLAEEFIPTLLAPGNYAVMLNRVPGDAGQIAMLAAFNNKTLPQFQVVLPKAPAQSTRGDAYVSVALVEEFNDISMIKPDKKIATSTKLKVSGAITFTAGA